MNAKDLPCPLPGFWYAVDGHEMAVRYSSMTREQLLDGVSSDMLVAFNVASLCRDDFDHEAVVQIAKDRIRWLSVQLALANADKADLLAALGKIVKGPHFEHGEGPEEQCAFDRQTAASAIAKITVTG